jgi:hypothetical protein
MKTHETETTELFGRFFTHYAKAMDENTTQESHSDRYYFINCLADSNIEFRLNKFNNGKQYQKLMKMEVKMVQAIVENFCKHFNDEPKDASRYPNKTAYRRHKAKMTGEKLAKIFLENIQ